MASVVLTGLGANYLTPGNYLELLFAQGPATGSSSVREMLFLGNATTVGTATRDTVIYGPDTPVPAQTEQDVITLTGAGSEIHRAFRDVAAINPNTTFRFVAVTESVGTAASATITIAVTATGSGNIRFYFDGTYYDTGYTTGDTPTVIAVAFCATLNAATWLPFTAGNSAGVVTLTAKLKGPRGNDLRWGILNSAGAGTTVTGTIDQAFTSGATADSNT